MLEATDTRTLPVQATFVNKVGGSEALEVRAGEPIREILRNHAIPTSTFPGSNL